MYIKTAQNFPHWVIFSPLFSSNIFASLFSLCSAKHFHLANQGSKCTAKFPAKKIFSEIIFFCPNESRGQKDCLSNRKSKTIAWVIRNSMEWRVMTVESLFDLKGDIYWMKSDVITNYSFSIICHLYNR